MTKEELKNKYSAFITEISEILGLGKPIDVLKLCATTDLFFQPLEKHIEELEKENAELKKEVEKYKWNNIFLEDCAVYDKKIAEEYQEPEAQIEKMKCCQNCKHCTEIKRYKALGGKEISKICSDGNYVCDKWEIKE